MQEQLNIASLPSDVALLQQVILQQQTLVQSLYHEKDALTTKCAALEQLNAELEGKLSYVNFRLEQLEKLIHGSKSERMVKPATESGWIQAPLPLPIEPVVQIKQEAGKEVKYIRTPATVTDNQKKHPGRGRLPASLRREVIRLEPDGDISGLKKIGEEITEVLEAEPGEVYVKQFIRPKYVLPLSDTQDRIITASLPGRLLEKCMAGEGLLAQILVDKYMDHLPLNRQMERLARIGVVIAQSTMNSWVQMVLDSLTGLYELHKQIILLSGYIHADETPLKVLDKDKKGATHRGYYWVYHSSELGMALFEYQEGRGREGPENMLKNYNGYLQTDGYAAYDSFANRPGITLLHCMAHARRYFFEAHQSDPQRAAFMLDQFGILYDVERTIKQQHHEPADILALRQQQAIPVLQVMKNWMDKELPAVLPKSPIGKAITYALARWDKLCLYTTDARLNIDNNPVENAIRPVAIGRKNYLFAGSHEAAQRAAMVYSLLATCKLHQINPYIWLRDVLQKMHLHNSSNLNLLLPVNWKKLYQQ